MKTKDSINDEKSEQIYNKTLEFVGELEKLINNFDFTTEIPSSKISVVLPSISILLFTLAEYHSMDFDTLLSLFDKSNIAVRKTLEDEEESKNEN